MSWVLVLVCDENYFGKYQKTARQIREQGKWEDDIVCLPSTSLEENQDFKNLNLQLKIETKVWSLVPINEDKKLNDKLFQYHKFHVFQTYFKKWDYVFYIDVGMEIIGDLNRFKKLFYQKERIYAHSDSYPTYQWNLARQFSNMIDNGDCNYFQTTMFIFHTSLLENNTVSDLVDLTNKLPLNIRNDQGVIAYYYCLEKPRWTQIQICDEKGFLYDYLPRPGFQAENYVMVKLR
jgi:hypothetical protein